MADLEKNFNTTSMKLDSEDYENIYLRVREKLLRFVGIFIAILGITNIGGIVALYNSFNNMMEKEINNYVESDFFKKTLSYDVSLRLAKLEKREKELTEALNLAEKRATALPNLPIAVSDKGVTLIGANGDKFHIETGHAKSGGAVTFTQGFNKAPTVLIVPILDKFGRPFDQVSITAKHYPSVEGIVATTTGFQVHSMIRNFEEYSWIAIGY